MRKVLIALALMSLPGAGARCQETPYYSRYYYSAGAGAAVPFGGHWGDGSAGFKAGPAFSLAGARKADDTLSYGLETAYSFGHANRGVPDLGLRIFSLTPFLRVASEEGGLTCFGTLGFGVYHWTQPSFALAGTDYGSDSGTGFGFNLGGGALLPLGGAWRLGLELRWHHLFSMKGDLFDVGPANNLTPSLLLFHGF